MEKVNHVAMKPVPIPRSRLPSDNQQDTKNNNSEVSHPVAAKPIPLPRKLLQRLQGSTSEKRKETLPIDKEQPIASSTGISEDIAKRGTINIFKRGRSIDPFEGFEKDFHDDLLRAISFSSPLQELSEEARARLSGRSSSSCSSTAQSNSDSSDYYDHIAVKQDSSVEQKQVNRPIPKKPERRFYSNVAVVSPNTKATVDPVNKTHSVLPVVLESTNANTTIPHSLVNGAIQESDSAFTHSALSKTEHSTSVLTVKSTSEHILEATYSRVVDELNRRSGSSSSSSSRTVSLPPIEESTTFHRSLSNRSSEGSNAPSNRRIQQLKQHGYDDVCLEDGTVVFFDNQLNTRCKLIEPSTASLNPSKDPIVMEFDPLFESKEKKLVGTADSFILNKTKLTTVSANESTVKSDVDSHRYEFIEVRSSNKTSFTEDRLSKTSVTYENPEYYPFLITNSQPSSLEIDKRQIPVPPPLSPVDEYYEDVKQANSSVSESQVVNDSTEVKVIENGDEVMSPIATAEPSASFRRSDGSNGSFLRRLSHKIRLIPIREESTLSAKPTSSSENLASGHYRCGKCLNDHAEGAKCRFTPPPRTNVVYSAYLYRPVGLAKKDFNKRWAVLAKGKLSFYNDKSVVLEEIPLDKCIQISKKSDQRIGPNGVQLRTFEISFSGWKNSSIIVGGVTEAERSTWMQKWVETYTSIFPMHMIYGFERGGICFVKESVTSDWYPSWLILKGRTLYQALVSSDEFVELDLRKARSVSLSTKDAEQKCPFVENWEVLTVDMITKILFIQTETTKTTIAWEKLISEAAKQNGTRFEEMQLTVDDVPVVVDKCIDFLYAHGTLAEGIYRQSGSNTRITQLLADFQKDSWSVQISHKEYSAHDVAGTLKRFFRTLPEPLFTSALYDSWINASRIVEEPQRLKTYEGLLDSLPVINYNILKKLICHLYAIHELHEKNLMPVNNLSPIWGPTLMNVEQSTLKLAQPLSESDEQYRSACAESEVVKELIRNYYVLFRVDTAAREREKKMQDALENFLLGATKRKCSGDMKIWIYIWEKDETTAINITLTPQGTAHTIIHQLSRLAQLRNYENLSLHEVVCRKSLERPLHPSEIVIETVLRWSIWDIDERKDNYLILKKNTLYPALVPYAKDPTAVYGDFKFADSKSKSFKKYAFKFGRAMLKYYKDAKAGTELGSWKIEDVVWYMGIEPKRNPPTRWAFTFVKRNYPFKRNREEPFFGNVICCNTEEELYKWIAAMGGAPGAPSYYPTAVAMYSTDKVMNGKPLGSSISASGSCFPGRYSPTYRGPDPMRSRCVNPTGDLFGGLNDGLLSREVLVDISKHPGASPPVSGLNQLKHDMMYHPSMGPPHPSHSSRPHQMGHHGMDGLDMLDSISSTTMMTSLGGMSGDGVSVSHAHSAHSQLHPSSMYSHSMNSMMVAASHPSLPHPHSHPHPGHPHPSVGIHDTDTDPRELEAFAERFKQRRIKLGVTQADVGKALANLKLPGVGALSQSTICRFESLTLSHNNMIALKPILQAWLEEAEAQARSKRRDPDAPNVLPPGEKKRKRTSIAAPEKRSLEAFFAVQPRPSGEKIAAMAEKLDLKKNVVRVWFCNQRQKQKRMKFAAQH